MKVKLKKHKKSPAPIAAEQAIIKTTIEALRGKHAYGVPTHVIYDRGYKQTIDLASVIQKADEKITAPLVAEQVSKCPKIMNNLYSSIKEIQEITDFSKACTLLMTEKWICLRIFAHKNILTFLLCRIE